MFILSVKAQTLKLFFSLTASVAIILAVVWIAPRPMDTNSVLVSKDISKDVFEDVATNEDRVEFLKYFGWEVDPDATKIQEVTLPSEFDSVYREYNEMQKEDGLDLEKYKGKSIKIYTYLVQNYEYDGSVYASIMIYKDTVIGGDVASARHGGFQHGLIKK